MDPAAGAVCLRLELHGRPRSAHFAAVWHGRDLSAGFRYHPVVVAHASATLGAMYPGRFWLGLGAGEALNEHVVGGEWPEIGTRSAMMFESIEIINKLFTGKVVKHDGEYFTLESARLYTRPEEPVTVYVATAGPLNAKRTGKLADGIITVGRGRREDPHALGPLRRWRARGRQGSGQPCPSCCRSTSRWAPTREEAERNALTEWPNGGMPFPKQDIRNPEDFADMAKLRQPGDFTNRDPHQRGCRRARRRHLQGYVEMGFDEIHVHNVGRNQAEFIKFFGERGPSAAEALLTAGPWRLSAKPRA